MKKKRSWIGLALYVGTATVPATALADRPLPVPREIRLKGLKGDAKAAAKNEAVQQLEVKYAERTLGDGRHVFVRTYNGELVGPTLKAKPGETIVVDLVNSLPRAPDDLGGGHHLKASNDAKGFNVTNLHFHGLHVRPDFPKRCDGSEYPTEREAKRKACGAVADNVLIDVQPGKSQRYEIEIPENQPPGTHWYHAHEHGATAMQLASGMAGALIIEGGLDGVEGIKGIEDRVLVFQQLSFSTCGRKTGDGGPKACGGLESCDTYFQRLNLHPAGGKDVQCVENFQFTFGAGKWPDVLQADFKDQTTINGEFNPTIKMKQGELQRWRFLHAGIRETIMLGLVPSSEEESQKFGSALTQGGEHRIPLRVIAYDGLATGRMDEVEHMELEPGYRVDALVRMDKPGIYELVDLPTSTNASLRVTSEGFQVLATVVVEPSTQKPMPLPKTADLANVAYNNGALVADEKVTGCQYTTFNITATDPKNPRFMVNEKPYEEAAPRQLVLGRTEEWVVSSKAGNHPFHIHVNPFQLAEDYNGLPRGTWKDTLLVLKDKPVRLRTHYEDFTGDFVLHCHILDHEDQGMMQEVQILPEEKAKEVLSCPVQEVSDPTDPDKKLKMCRVPPLADGRCSPSDKAVSQGRQLSKPMASSPIP